MRERDKAVFRKASKEFNAWILVRRTNTKSLDFVGSRIYQPKPINCKPKTATVDVHGKTIAGLVADPMRWPDAFGDRLAKALELWTEFRAVHRLGTFRRLIRGGFAFDGARSAASGFAIDVEPGSKHEGCLTYEGKYLYGDYDLFDIVFPGDRTRQPAAKVEVGSRHKPFRTNDYRGPRWEEFRSFLNGQLGFELIQHGAMFDYKEEKIEKEEKFKKEEKFEKEKKFEITEPVHAFGPNGEAVEWNVAKIKATYREWGRR
jgi:hypothetical protein